MAESRFNKKILSLLIEKAAGNRTLKKYATDCGISYMQVRKLFLCAQENPPRKALITKLSSCADNGITYEDFAFACGVEDQNFEKSTQPEGKYDILAHKISKLSSGQKKTAMDFIDFLTYRS